MDIQTAKRLVGSPVHFNAGDENYNGFIASVDEEQEQISVVLIDGTYMNHVSASLIYQEHDTHAKQVR